MFRLRHVVHLMTNAVIVGSLLVFVLVMGVGSIAGSFVGCQMLGVVPTFVLLPMLAAALLVAAVKVWLPGRHPLKTGQG